MATKKKAGTVTIAPEGVSGKPVKGQKRVNPDGSPFVPTPRRSNAELVAEYQAKKEAAIARHAALIAKYDSRIARFSKVSVASIDPEEAAKELLDEGYDAASIAALEAKIKAAKKYLKNNPPVPAFLGGAVEAPEDEESDEDEE